MNDDNGYRLVDFGRGRKLESFAGWLVDRPCPAADHVQPRSADAWGRSRARFDAKKKQWSFPTASRQDDAPSLIDFGSLVMPFTPTPFGHVGVFPEQKGNWSWLAGGRVKTDSSQSSPTDLSSGLNLFAYTGASSIAMAKGGHAVAHVDAAKPNVNAARSAAKHNSLGDHPIRYLVDDALKFAKRECRRNQDYQTIVLDPPAYGHSPNGKTWRLQRDLWPLLENCLKLFAEESMRLLITGHSPQVTELDVVEYLRERVPSANGYSAAQINRGLDAGRLTLCDRHGRKLDAGFSVRLDIQR